MGLAFGLPSGLVLGLTVGVESGVDAGTGAGLLRLSGTAIQFRHRDLQTHLVDEV